MKRMRSGERQNCQGTKVAGKTSYFYNPEKEKDHKKGKKIKG